MKATAQKLIALSLAAAMALGLTACGGGSSNGGGSSADSSPSASGEGGTAPPSYADEMVIGVTAEPKNIEPNGPGVGPAETHQRGRHGLHLQPGARREVLQR